MAESFKVGPLTNAPLSSPWITHRIGERAVDHMRPRDCAQELNGVQALPASSEENRLMPVSVVPAIQVEDSIPARMAVIAKVVSDFIFRSPQANARTIEKNAQKNFFTEKNVLGGSGYSWRSAMVGST